MECPKCKSKSVRLKMTGAICLNCDWSTHDRTKTEITTSNIAKKFKEQELLEDYGFMELPF